MKLYATVASERAKKGQGGNKEIAIVLSVGSAKDSRPIALFKLLALQNGSYEVFYRNNETDEAKLLQKGEITKGKREKGKTMRQQIREDLREEREHDAFSSGMQ